MDNPMDLSAAVAAKLVKREVAEAAKDGTARMVKVAIDPDDVFACRVRGEDVTVITTDGQRLTGLLPAGAAKVDK